MEHRILHKFEKFALPLVHLKVSFLNHKIFVLMSTGIVSVFSQEFSSDRRRFFDRFSEKSTKNTFDVTPDGAYIFGISSNNPSLLSVFKDSPHPKCATLTEQFATFNSQNGPIK